VSVIIAVNVRVNVTANALEVVAPLGTDFDVAHRLGRVSEIFGRNSDHRIDPTRLVAAPCGCIQRESSCWLIVEGDRPAVAVARRSVLGRERARNRGATWIGNADRLLLQPGLIVGMAITAGEGYPFEPDSGQIPGDLAKKRGLLGVSPDTESGGR